MAGLVLLTPLADGPAQSRPDADGELLAHVTAMERILRDRAAR
jgi:hypothetical protein